MMLNWNSPIIDGASIDQQFDYVRAVRDAELIATDWTQVADSTADKTAWATYRKALRDLPASNTDPKKIVFPTRPV
jgi:hypothetical protein